MFCSFFCLYFLTFRQTQTLLALWLQTWGPAHLFWHKGIVRTRWLKDSKREREGKETVRQTKRARPTGSHSRREEHAVTNYCAERCTLSPHISTFSFFRGKARNEKLVFSRQFSQMLLSKCYFLSKNKWIKGKQKKDNGRILPVNNHLFLCPSRAWHFPRACFDGGHLKRNKSILLFVHCYVPLRRAEFVCIPVYCSLCPLPFLSAPH